MITISVVLILDGQDKDSIKINRAGAKKSSASAISRARAAEKGKYSFHRRNAARLVAIHPSIDHKSIAPRRIEKDRSGEITFDRGKLDYLLSFFSLSLSFPLADPHRYHN